MDLYSKEKRREIMSLIKSKDSRLEKDFQKFLKDLKISYRRNNVKNFGKPDFILNKHKAVVFVDSCFWHGCKKHGSMPKTNKKFWKDKLEKNVERDKEVSKYYKKVGWKVLRIWEHDINKNLEKIFKTFLNKRNNYAS